MSELRKRLGPPAVEPLSDVSWSRVERAVFAELDAPGKPVATRATRRWPVLVMPLAAAAALVVWLVVRPGDPPAQVASGGHERPARVVTADAPTELSFGDAVITASPQSTLVLGGSADGGVMVVVERGGARFDVSPRAGRPKFQVQAGDVAVRVVGTRFVVSRDGSSATVEVVEGTVEVVARGERALVSAGDRWPAAAPTPSPSPSPSPSLSPPPSPSVSPPPSSSPSPRRSPSRKAPEPDDDREDDDVTAEPTSKDQFESAARLERSQPAEALARYQTLARGTGPWAANALFAAGRLAFDRGDTDLSRQLLTRYLRRFPRGGNAVDAQALLDRM